jgi:hypothetical protein
MKLLLVASALFCYSVGANRAAAQDKGSRFLQSSETLFSPFSPESRVDVSTWSGNGTLEFLPGPTNSPLGGEATRINIEAKADGFVFWLKANTPLAEGSKQISWWVYSRSMPWADVKVVLESPDGQVRRYKAPSLGESAWTRYVVALDGLGTPIDSLPANAQPTAGWKFRGLTLGYQPFQKGSIYVGELTTSSQPLAKTLTDSWSLRDVDESVTYQSAYTGFNMAYTGEGETRRVPLPLLLFPARRATQVSWQVTDGSGKIVDGGEKSLATLTNLRSTDFVLPRLPAANYWVRFKLFDAKQQLLSQYLASYLVHRGRAVKPIETKNASFDIFWPNQGAVELRVQGPFAKAVEVPLQGVRIGDSIVCDWRDGSGASMGKGATIVSDPAKIALLPPMALRGQQRFELQLELRRNRELLDKRTVGLLVRQNAEPLKDVAPRKSGAFCLRETGTFSLRADQSKPASDFIQHVGQNGSQALLTFNWSEIEPARGFIQYALLDKRLREATEAKVPVIFTVYAHLDHVPRWLWYEQMLSQNGQNDHYSASYIRRTSPVATQARAALVELARALMTRYKNNSQIVGWNFSQGVESFWSDASRNGYVVDYSRTASSQFATYLRQKGWNLKRISDALGHPVANWDDVTPPQPIFSDSLDLRPIWLAWQAWKQVMPAQTFDQTLTPLRLTDPKRDLYLYAMLGTGDPTGHLAVFKKHHAITCFGGSNAAISPFFESLAEQMGVELEAESSAVPPYEPSLQLALFYKLSHGGTKGGSNIMWGRFFDAKNPLHQGAAKSASQWMNLANLASASRPRHSGLAIGVGMQSLINKTRSFMFVDWVNTEAYGFAPMLNQTVNASSQAGYVTDATPLDQLQKWPGILFQQSPLLDDATAQRLANYVRSGGKLILQADTGSINQKGEKTTLLRQLLGVKMGDETVQKVGRGQVQWLSTPIDWLQADVVRRVAAWTGYTPPVTSSESTVRHALRVAADGKTFYLVLFGKTWQGGGNPRLEQLGQTPVSSNIQFNSLAAGVKWRITDLEGNTRLGEKSSEELRAGLPLEVKPGLLRILKLEQF